MKLTKLETYIVETPPPNYGSYQQGICGCNDVTVPLWTSQHECIFIR